MGKPARMHCLWAAWTFVFNSKGQHVLCGKVDVQGWTFTKGPCVLEGRMRCMPCLHLVRKQ